MRTQFSAYWYELQSQYKYNNNNNETTPNNKPDIIIRDNQKGTCMLTDVAISGDGNVI